MSYYTSPDLVIHAVRKLGEKHPKPVQDLLDAAQALEEIGKQAPSWEGIEDPTKVVDVVQEQVRYRVMNSDELREVRNQARTKIANALAREMEDHTGAYLKAIQKTFEAAANQYTEAVAELPREFDSKDLLEWEPVRFDAYTRAKQANAVLDQAKTWMFELGKVVNSENYPPSLSTELLVLEPQALEHYVSIQTADGTCTDNALRAVNPVRLKAVKDGVPLRLSLPSKVRKAVTQFEAQCQQLSDTEARELRLRAPAY